MVYPLSLPLTIQIHSGTDNTDICAGIRHAQKHSDYDTPDSCNAIPSVSNSLFRAHAIYSWYIRLPYQTFPSNLVLSDAYIAFESTAAELPYIV